MSGITIRTIWSDEITPGEIEDFRFVVNTVFGNFCTEEYFKAKYLDNIYGPSLLFLAYLDDKPVAAEALWRNDINGKEAYHSADTCVLRDCPVKGVFGAMLKHKADFAARRKDVLLFAFPNKNSSPGFIIAGWNVKSFYMKPFIPGLSSEKELTMIDDNYAAWWLTRRRGIRYIKRFGHYYLVAEMKRNSRILGRVEEKTALRFQKSKRFPQLLYMDSETPCLVTGKRITSKQMYYSSTDPRIPLWKMDSIKGKV